MVELGSVTHTTCCLLKRKQRAVKDFHQIVIFSIQVHIGVLLRNPLLCIFIQQFANATASTLDNGEMEITATIDRKVKIVSEASIRRHLKLEDSDGISNLPTTEIFEQLALMGCGCQTWRGYHYCHGLEAGQGSGNIDKTPTMPYDSPLPRVNTLGSDEGKVQGRHEHDMESNLEFTATEEVYTAEKELVLLSQFPLLVHQLVLRVLVQPKIRCGSSKRDAEEELGQESSKRQKIGESSQQAKEQEIKNLMKTITRRAITIDDHSSRRKDEY
ncbi:hypothetical protein Tco_0550855 [Tanacetum coccineum]